MTARSIGDGRDPDLLDTTQLNDEGQANICLSCPPLLLQVIRDVSRWSQPPNASYLPLRGIEQLLSIVDAFDPYTWTRSLQNISSVFDLEMRTHIGCAYKAAVKIYVLRAAGLTVQKSMNPKPLEDLVSEAITHLSYVPHDDPFMKAICWPTFMAGAETNDPEQRAWALKRFEMAQETLPWGYLCSAVDLLETIWTQRDQGRTRMDWLINLKLSEDDWLIA